MRNRDFESILALWHATPGIRVSEADSPELLARFLDRNPGLSFVAQTESRIVGTIMAGHDGRRGYLQHLAVAPDFRRRGIGTQLVRTCLEALAKEGILKAHLFVLCDNADGIRFWQRQGWQPRGDICMYSRHTA